MFILLGLSLIFSIAMCWHVVRNHQPMYWLFIILAFQPIGGIVYLLVAVLPDVADGPTSRRLQGEARRRLDPTREYREAQARLEETPTVANQMRLAEAAVELGKHDEAERLYAAALTGVHADDPALLLGRARALVELGRWSEALAVLHTLGELGEKGRTGEAALLMARAHEGEGRIADADVAYQWAAERLPGLEALARYAVFLAEVGRTEEARAMLADIDKRHAKVGRHFRREAGAWRAYAAERVPA